MSCGIDMAKVDRFEKLKDNTTFINKIFNENEIKYLEEKHFNTNTIAGMFCAKEAFLKAIKKGLDVPLKDIEVAHDNGAPYLILHNDLKNYNNVSISISHDGDYAIAIVISLDTVQ